MNRSEYIQKVANMRHLRAECLRVSDLRIRSVLETALGEVESILSLKKPGTVTYATYKARKASINRALADITRGVNLATRVSLRDVTERISEEYRAVVVEYSASKGVTIDADAAFNTVPVEVARNVTGRLWADGRNFSDRIWQLGTGARDGVNKIISSGVVRGQSAVSMAKDLRNLLIEPAITPEVSFTTKGVKSVSGRGTIHARALTLARTEINNAYRETMVASAIKNPIVGCMKWHLSGSHPKPDICDVWATVDAYGLGEGCYPPASAPIDHPNGLCYTTEQLRPPAEWSKPKEEHARAPMPKSDVLRSLDGKGLKDGEINAAWKMWNSINKMVDKSKDQYGAAA